MQGGAFRTRIREARRGDNSVKRYSHILSALAGIGIYIVLQATMDYIDRRGDQQVAQACVQQDRKSVV